MRAAAGLVPSGPVTVPLIVPATCSGFGAVSTTGTPRRQAAGAMSASSTAARPMARVRPMERSARSFNGSSLWFFASPGPRAAGMRGRMRAGLAASRAAHARLILETRRQAVTDELPLSDSAGCGQRVTFTRPHDSRSSARRREPNVARKSLVQRRRCRCNRLEFFLLSILAATNKAAPRRAHRRALSSGIRSATIVRMGPDPPAVVPLARRNRVPRLAARHRVGYLDGS